MDFEIDFARQPEVLPPDKEVAPTVIEQNDFIEAAKKLYGDVAPSTGRVRTERGTGSAFFISDDLVITDGHVVQDSRVQRVVTTDGKYYHARIEKLDDVNDLALLRLDGAKRGNYKPLKLDTEIEPGERAYAFGHPEGTPFVTVSPGVVNGISTQLDYLVNTRTSKNLDDIRQSLNHMDRMLLEMSGRAHEIKEIPSERENWLSKVDGLPDNLKADASAWLDAPTVHGLIDVRPGNSGGALTDGDGEVIGVARVTESHDYASSGFTPASVVKDFIESPESKFKFNYEYFNTSPVVGLYSNDPVTMSAATGGSSFAAYKIAPRMPKTSGILAIGLGAKLLTDDIGQREYLTNERARFQNSVEIGADAVTAGGGMAAMAKRTNKYGLVIAGLGLASRLAAEFIPTETRLESMERLDGSRRPPFSPDVIGVK